MGRKKDTDSKSKADKRERVSGPAGRFVKRLIPTVAAASLSFTSCLPTGGGNNGGGNNGGGDAGGFDIGGGQDSGGDGNPIANVNGDGMVSSFEIRQFCQGWSDCDTAYFQQSYGTVEECVTQIETYFAEQQEYYEQYYGPECAAAMEEMTECTIGNTECVDGQLDYGYYDCYDNDAYYEYCYY